MSDIEKAKKALDGHTIAVALGGKIITSDSRGISPMVEFIERGETLRGGSIADLIVGKAAALLFAYAGIVEVYARVLSTSAAKTLDRFGISFTYGEPVDKIINRNGDGTCPMEQITEHIDDPAAALEAIKNKLAELCGK